MAAAWLWVPLPGRGLILLSEPNWMEAVLQGNRGHAGKCAAWWDWHPESAGIEKSKQSRAVVLLLRVPVFLIAIL